MSVALLFSPQGSQAVGMGRTLAVSSRAAAEVFARADAAFAWSVSDLAWNGPADRLDDTRYTQPALVTCGLAARAALLDRVQPTIACVAGHSVGEYAAIVAAGAVTLEDGVRLAARRGELMAAQGVTGGMAAVIGLDRERIEAVIADVARPTELVVANDNAPGQIVISGTEDALDAAEPALRGAGARRVIRLNVSGAFHSPAMAPVVDDLATALHAVEWRDASVPVVANATAEPLTDATRIRSGLAEQVRSPVEWVASIRRMAADGVDTFVECGPGATLVGMVRRIAPDATALAVNDPATLDEAVEALAERRATPTGASV